MRILNVSLVYVLSLLIVAFVLFYGLVLLNTIDPTFTSYIGTVMVSFAVRWLQVDRNTVIVAPQTTEKGKE